MEEEDAGEVVVVVFASAGGGEGVVPATTVAVVVVVVSGVCSDGAGLTWLREGEASAEVAGEGSVSTDMLSPPCWGWV